MITEECTKIGNINRKRYDAGTLDFLPYPEGCECACMHRMPEAWEKQYRSDVIPPWKKILQETEVL